MDPAANSSSDDRDDDSSSSENRHVSDPVRDAILTINDGKGVDIDGIYEFVKARRHDDLLPTFRDVLEVELNTRVSVNELEKVDNLYRITDVASSENTHDETTEAESEEPVAVAHPSRSSSWGTHDGDMVVITIRTLNDGNGADIDEIYDYIQDIFPIAECQKHLLEIELNERVNHNELEMVDDTRYKIVKATSESTHDTTETVSKSVADSDVQKDPAATSASDYSLPYGDMPEAIVIEAISRMDFGVGVHIDEIYQYIENRYKIPTDYMNILEDELNKRVSENEVEKGEYGYKIVDDTSDNMDESQSQAVAVADQKDPAKSSSSSDASTSSGNTPLNDPVIDAISTINDGNGVDIDGILQFIQAKSQRIFSPNYRKHLEGGLKRRVSQCILEKVETHYKILDITPAKLDEISEAAAKALAESDQKDLEAKEASEAADRAKKALEENELVLQVAKEALARYTRGD